MKLYPLETPHMMAHALAYARRGFPVIPIWEPFGAACTCGNPDCESPAKHPVGSLAPHGKDDATTDPQIIRRWWTARPNANIAICIPPGIVVIDADARNAGLATFEELARANGDPPGTLRCFTGSGGGSFHEFFKTDKELQANRPIGQGLDVKAHAGYVVAVPSLHVSGNRYRWDPETPRNIAPLPPAWEKLIGGKNGDQPKKKIDTAGVLEGVPEGQRDETLFKFACKLRRADIPIEAAWDLVLKAARNCKPPFSDKKARAKLENAYGHYSPEGATQDAGLPAHWKEYDAANVEAWDCPAMVPIIDGILARGNLFWIGGQTQAGKSLVALHICRRLIVGGKLFDHFDVTAVDRIAYFVLEDPPRRIKDRILDELREGDLPTPAGRLIFKFYPGLKFTDDEHLSYLEKWILAEKFDVVVIDTYQRATPGISSFDAEKQSVICHRLADLTRKHGITIIVIDHFRKSPNAKKRTDPDVDDIKGEGGKTQNADAYLLIDRIDGRMRVMGSSKEWGEKIGFLLDIAQQGDKSKAKYTYAGDLSALVKTSKARGEDSVKRILAAMEGDAWMALGEITDKTGLADTTVRDHLRNLIKKGEVEDNGLELRWKRYKRILSPSKKDESIDSANRDKSDSSINGGQKGLFNCTENGGGAPHSKGAHTD